MIKWMLLLLLASGIAAAAPVPERWRMEIGEARRLKVEANSSLRLSQKHILDVDDQGGGHYQIVALRSGVVYVRSVDAQGRVQQSWVVDVASRSESVRDERWKNLLCREPGIRCDEASSTVSGHTDSLSWLHRSREVCEKNPPCRFQAQLHEEARAKLESKITADLKVLRTSIDTEGFITLEQACAVPDPKREEQWRQWIKDRYGAPVRVNCVEHADGRYRLDVVAIAEKKSDMDVDNPIQYGPLQILPAQDIEVFLQGLNQKSRTKILARPQVALNLGSTLEISDGMEIATLAPQRDQTLEIWKAVGFLLQIKLIEQRGDAVKAGISLQISRPREGQRTLDRSGMQTETWLTLDRLQEVGQIQARTEGSDASEIPWLGSIPWLGALFRWNVESAGDSSVTLLLRLQKLEEPSLSGN